MAKVKKQNYKELATEEIVQKVADEKLRYRKLRFNHAVSPIENPLVLRQIKKDIARMNTELRRRELEEKK